MAWKYSQGGDRFILGGLSEKMTAFKDILYFRTVSMKAGPGGQS
jgi:hypothetical protein